MALENPVKTPPFWPGLAPVANNRECRCLYLPLTLLHAAGCKVGHGCSAGFVYIEPGLCLRHRFVQRLCQVTTGKEKVIAKAAERGNKDSGVV